MGSFAPVAPDFDFPIRLTATPFSYLYRRDAGLNHSLVESALPAVLMAARRTGFKSGGPCFCKRCAFFAVGRRSVFMAVRPALPRKGMPPGTTHKQTKKQTERTHIMARKKRTSPIAEAAGVRADSLESIDTNLDLGNGNTLAAFRSAISGVAFQLSTYNTKLSELDGLLNALEAGEKGLADFSERMLTGVATKFGKNSDQYEKAGGTKKSEIKRGPKKKTPPTP